MRQLYGITLMPEQIRGTLVGFTQCLLPQGSEALLGSADPDDGGGACDGDTLAQDGEPGRPEQERLCDYFGRCVQHYHCEKEHKEESTLSAARHPLPFPCR